MKEWQDVKFNSSEMGKEVTLHAYSGDYCHVDTIIVHSVWHIHFFRLALLSAGNV